MQIPVKPLPAIVLDYISRTFKYDPNTGVIFGKAGKPVGYRVKDGPDRFLIRLSISVPLPEYERCSLQTTARAHQVAWYLSYGVWPTTIIDHIDGDGTNNRLSNLREATPAQNAYNRTRRSAVRNGTDTHDSQYKGVRKANAKTDKGLPWRSVIVHHGKFISLGSYATEWEAAEAYNTKAKELFGEYASLNVRL
jgi:hypothetical protein